MAPALTRSPVLFLIFNRPDTTAQVFARIRDARPPRLYIAADGPRTSRQGETQLCEEARAVAVKVDWSCQVRTLFREANLGCKDGVASAIDWFFQQEEEGIILEDDCLPASDFFTYCDALLERYRFDNRIRHIGGSNLQHGQKRGDASYYFSQLTHVWGWAGWRRVWRDYDKNLSSYSTETLKTAFEHIYEDPLIAESWSEIASRLKNGKIDTWDYQLTFTNMMHHGMSTIPNVNLITNIGYRPDGTHTHDANNRNANLATGSLATLTHPSTFVPDRQADLYTLQQDFNIEQRRTAEKRGAPTASSTEENPITLSTRKKVKNWLKKRLDLNKLHAR